MHLSMFSPDGMGDAAAGIPPGVRNFENMVSNSLPTSNKCVSEIPWKYLKIYTEFLLDFSI